MKGRKSENKLAQNLGVCGLRIAEIHHLIKELVDDDKVIADALLTNLAKVLLQRVNELVKEEKCHCPVHIAVSDCKDCMYVYSQGNVRKTKKKKGVNEGAKKLTNTRDWHA